MNASLSIVVTVFGTVNGFKLVQSENAEYPIYVTPSGIVTEVNALQLENAS